MALIISALRGTVNMGWGLVAFGNNLGYSARVRGALRSICMDDFSNPPSVEEQRRFRRRPVLWKGHVDLSTHRLECRVLNITPGGLLAELELPLAAGVQVRVLLPNVRPLSAEIKWYADGLHGLSFSEPPAQIRAAFGNKADALGFNIAPDPVQ